MNTYFVQVPETEDDEDENVSDPEDNREDSDTAEQSQQVFLQQSPNDSCDDEDSGKQRAGTGSYRKKKKGKKEENLQMQQYQQLAANASKMLCEIGKKRTEEENKKRSSIDDKDWSFSQMIYQQMKNIPDDIKDDLQLNIHRLVNDAKKEVERRKSPGSNFVAQYPSGNFRLSPSYQQNWFPQYRNYFQAGNLGVPAGQQYGSGPPAQPYASHGSFAQPYASGPLAQQYASGVFQRFQQPEPKSIMSLDTGTITTVLERPQSQASTVSSYNVDVMSAMSPISTDEASQR